MSAPATVLLVEDGEADRYIAVRALARAWPDTEILHARDGRGAVELLEAVECVGTRSPELIVLDLHMPRMNGHQFLAARYADPDVPVPAVAVLTSSDRPEDRASVGRYRCVQAYLLKPLRVEALERLADSTAA